MVGTEFRLKVHQATDVVVNEQRMKVFQYYKKHVHWCRGQFRDYQIFSSSAKILANDYVQSLPP